MARSKRRLRALVLCAGRGDRLRPLSDAVPKPLLPVAGQPLLAHTLARLAAAGCEGAALNLHHLGGQIRSRFGDAFGDLPLTYSEEPVLLGTLGALGPLAGYLGEADLVLLLNGDSLCRWPLRQLVRRHLRTRARVTLLLTRRADPAAFGGGVGVDGAGRVVSLRPGGVSRGEAARRWVFAGAHVLAPDLLSAVGSRPADVVADLYEPLLAAGSPIHTLLTRRRWHDFGTPRRYRDGLLAWVRGPRPWRRSWISPGAEVAAGARISGTVVEAEAVVEAGAAVSDSVVLNGARVGRGASLRRAILGFGARLPAGARVEGRLIAAAGSGSALGPRDSLVGELVYRPIEEA